METTAQETLSAEDWSANASARSQIYGFLGTLYCKLPDERFIEGLFGQDFAAFMNGLAQADDANGDMRAGAELAMAFVAQHQDAPHDELKTKVGVERTRLMRGVKPGYGPLPPYESVYMSANDQEVDSAPIVTAIESYAQAGVVLPKDAYEQPDYIGIELDFMRHLCAKEAQAWADGNRDEALASIEQQRRFVNDHAAPWIPRYCDAMFGDAKLGLYQGIARITQGFVCIESQQLAERLELARTA